MKRMIDLFYPRHQEATEKFREQVEVPNAKDANAGLGDLVAAAALGHPRSNGSG